MVTFIAPTAPVAAPARTALPYGLGSVLGWRNGDRWETGVNWSSLPCEPVLGRGGPGCEPNVFGAATVVTLAITGTPTSGTFQITDGTLTSTAIDFDATAAEVATAMTAFGVTATGGPLPGTPVQITYTAEGDTPALSITGSTLDVGTAGITVVTRGADEEINIPGLPKPIEDAGGPAYGEATPFVLFGLYRCLSVATSVEEAQEWANASLAAGEEARAEQALWTGDLGNVPNFSGANGYEPAVPLAATTDPVEALAQIEQSIATGIRTQGVIHMSPAMATRLAKYLDSRGGRLYTRAMGTPVVAGAGYPDMKIVGTSPLFGYRSEVFNSSERPGDLFDRAGNWMNAIAERSYLVGFDPCPVYMATITEEVA